jgi:hypothetical protein
LWALPADKIADYAERVAALASANNTLASFHTLRRADVTNGLKPTVSGSLERLQNQ